MTGKTYPAEWRRERDAARAWARQWKKAAKFYRDAPVGDLIRQVFALKIELAQAYRLSDPYRRAETERKLALLLAVATASADIESEMDRHGSAPWTHAHQIALQCALAAARAGNALE